MRRLSLALAASGILTFSQIAHAGASASTDAACGSAAVYWNAPNGAAVFNRGAGPLTDVISAVGEYRSHSMLSNANVKYVTQAAAKTPDRPGWPTFCSTPLDSNQLRDGWAGAEQISQGAIYTYLYGNGSQEAVYYQNGNADQTNKGSAIANWAWNSMPYTSVASQRDGGQYMYRLKNTNGNPINYVLFQFRNSENASSGGSNWENGNICSSLLASLQVSTLGAGNQVNPWTYQNSQLATGLNALYTGVHSQCSNGMGFWSGLGATVACPFSDICDNAGNEVANCMSTGKCSTNDSGVWNGVKNDRTNGFAQTISPDHIAGWSGHPSSGAGTSVWAYDTNNTVTWSSSGNVYGCWY